MQITIELEPETEAVVRQQARARGVDVHTYIQSLVRQCSSTPAATSLTREEFEREWALLSEGSEGIPSLSDEDLSRAALYADHD